MNRVMKIVCTKEGLEHLCNSANNVSVSVDPETKKQYLTIENRSKQLLTFPIEFLEVNNE